jgi:16S rRNA (cytidine1402-2'-O)-methyltransferase
MPSGKIYLIPSPISESDLKNIMPSNLIEILKELDTFFVENIRSSRRFLSKTGIKNIEDIHFEVLDKDTVQQQIEFLIDIVKDDKNVGIMSEAGCPGIADPGSSFTMLAHEHNIDIIPLTGPSSIFLALMASGFNGQSFQFHGYLPIDNMQRKKKIKYLEKLVYSNNQTQIFMETPYRNNQILEALLKFLKPQTKLCIACNLTAADEYIKTKHVKVWRKLIPDIHKKPTIFLINR